ncbi:hypothetical protein BDN71DRAFT_233621 [Pleurotus eryngii]|uniref:Uncharacterized protein n=1 Tax=Pleurotus eryngii TaxID=5323 RepID=A0A9P6DC36_PLEER|nr:hypothetical protein BDN71DRAFT_233621 [Pleurotus eryngii]
MGLRLRGRWSVDGTWFSTAPRLHRTRTLNISRRSEGEEGWRERREKAEERAWREGGTPRLRDTERSAFFLLMSRSGFSLCCTIQILNVQRSTSVTLAPFQIQCPSLVPALPLPFVLLVYTYLRPL